MVDKHTRESLLDMTDVPNAGEKVIDRVKKIIAQRGAPLVIRYDNGPEFISQEQGLPTSTHQTEVSVTPRSRLILCPVLP
ncbi:MAG: hypothetical protein OSA11_02035 [Candidatus Nanopelagicales bacterium]|nr:hypothetical protein [Candidatus Nanopelagicales bacterium]